MAAGSGTIASGQQSDHLLMVAAFNGWQAAKVKVHSVLPAPLHDLLAACCLRSSR